MIKLHNTLTRKLDSFKPIKKGFVGIYSCGPTVYGPGHLGHARSYTNFDLLKRVFLYHGFKVKHVLNITDIHDDMIKKARELGISINQLANRYIPLFKKDLQEINIIKPTVFPRVIRHIPEIIKMTKILLKKGYAYIEKDGSVYFDISRFKNYGKLSGIKLKELKTGTRVETDKYEKEEISDFALWKGTKPGEPYWLSPWGKGRPGWHIECSVMSQKYLGKTIDIHAGAMDLKFPHHENEIAQSEAANNVKFVNYWVHAGLLEVEGKKMSKSLGNYIEIHEIKEKGFSPLALRYLFLTAHYRQKLNFTWKSLEASQRALERLYEKTNELKAQSAKRKVTAQSVKFKKYKKDFLDYISDDLNVPQALALVWKMLKDKTLLPAEKYFLLIDFDKVFGFNLCKAGLYTKRERVPAGIKKLVAEREKLRKEKQWQKADEIRKKIEKLGWQIEDAKEGPIVRG